MSTSPHSTGTSPAKTDSSRASLLILGLGAFLVQADARVMDPLLKTVAADFQIAKESASFVLTLYLLSYGLFQLLYGPLGDRVGKLRVMAVALGLFALGELVCATMRSLPLFATLRFVNGMFAAAVIPLSLGYIGEKFPYEQRQVALGRFMSALMMGQIMGSTLGGIFGKHIGWRGTYVVFAGVALIAALLLLRESRRHPEAERPDRKFSLTPIQALWAKPMTRIVLTTVFVEGLLVFGGLPYFGASLQERFGLRSDLIGLLLTGVGIGGLIYSVSVKKLVPKLGELGTLLLGGSLLLIGYTLIGLLPTWWLFVPAVTLFGMGYYTMHGPLQTRATELAPEMRGTAVALFAFAFFLGQAVGPVLMGQLVKGGHYALAFPLAGVGLFALALVARAAFNRRIEPR